MPIAPLKAVPINYYKHRFFAEYICSFYVDFLYTLRIFEGSI